MSIVKIGMARGALAGTFREKCPVHDPLEAVVFFVEDANAKTAIVSMDLCYLSAGLSRRVRQQIAAQCGLAAEALVLHLTHDHTSPEENEIYPEALADCLAGVLREAQGAAAPAQMAYAEVDTGRQFNINRRKALAGIGTFTLWLGYEDFNGDPDGGRFNRARLSHWRGAPVSEADLPMPMLYDGPTDGLVQGLFFRTPDGRPIGSLVRYAAHACAANHSTPRKYSADFPGVVKRRLEAAFGGTCGFLTGPCGNLAPREGGPWPEPEFPADRLSVSVPWVPQTDPEMGRREARRIGDGLADAILTRMPAAKEFRMCDRCRVSPHELVLPVREDLLEDIDEAKRQAAGVREEFLRVRKSATLGELKRLADRINFLEFHSVFYEDMYHYLTREQCRARRISASMPLVVLNDIMLLGLPGEVFWETAQPAARAAAGKRLTLISFTEANGDIGYIPTEAERPGGDYESCCSILAVGAEQTIRETAVEVVRRCGF